MGTKKSPYLAKQKTKTSEAKLPDVPAENMPPADYKPEEDQANKVPEVPEENKAAEEQNNDETNWAVTN